MDYFLAFVVLYACHLCRVYEHTVSLEKCACHSWYWNLDRIQIKEGDFCKQSLSSAVCFMEMHSRKIFIPVLDVEASEINYIPEEEKAVFISSQELPVGQCYLHLDFTGTLNDKMKGFYRSKYNTPDGEERHCAVTQFEVCVN